MVMVMAMTVVAGSLFTEVPAFIFSVTDRAFTSLAPFLFNYPYTQNICFWDRNFLMIFKFCSILFCLHSLPCLSQGADTSLSHVLPPSLNGVSASCYQCYLPAFSNQLFLLLHWKLWSDSWQRTLNAKYAVNCSWRVWWCRYYLSVVLSIYLICIGQQWTHPQQTKTTPHQPEHHRVGDYSIRISPQKLPEPHLQGKYTIVSENLKPHTCCW